MVAFFGGASSHASARMARSFSIWEPMIASWRLKSAPTTDFHSLHNLECFYRIENMEPAKGIEPPTYGLRNRFRGGRLRGMNGLQAM